MKKIFIKLRNKIIGFFGHLKFAFTIFPGIVYKQSGYKVKGIETNRVLTLIEPGDILVRGYDSFLSSRLIGKWSHVAIVVDRENIIHSVGKGVIKETIIDFCRTDRIAIMRIKPGLIQDNDITEAIYKAHHYLGTKYDYGFNFNDAEEFSCTELLNICFKHIGKIIGMHKRIFSILGLYEKEVIDPVMFLESYDGLENIYSSDKCETNKRITD
jgi:uncharacterized protein YycO